MTQYATWDRVTTWLIDRLFMGPFFRLCGVVSDGIADLGGDD